jgi:hypothetical protein
MKKELLQELVCELLKGETNCSSDDLPFEIGESYLIRTVTYHVLGKVKSIKGNFLVMEEASWVADSGKFSVALEKGTLNEVEYVGKVIVALNAIADAYPWNNKLPKETK